MVWELLKTEVDLTLWSRSRQTALHLSSPELQMKMVRWMVRPHLSPQAQLLQAAWQGDSASLSHLLVRSTPTPVDFTDEHHGGRQFPPLTVVYDSNFAQIYSGISKEKGTLHQFNSKFVSLLTKKPVNYIVPLCGFVLLEI